LHAELWAIHLLTNGGVYMLHLIMSSMKIDGVGWAAGRASGL